MYFIIFLFRKFNLFFQTLIASNTWNNVNLSTSDGPEILSGHYATVKDDIMYYYYFYSKHFFTF